MQGVTGWSTEAKVVDVARFFWISNVPGTNGYFELAGLVGSETELLEESLFCFIPIFFKRRAGDADEILVGLGMKGNFIISFWVFVELALVTIDIVGNKGWEDDWGGIWGRRDWGVGGSS